MRLENLIIEYHEHLQNVRSFPDASPSKKFYKQKLSDYLKSVKDRYGQDIVDQITNKKERHGNIKL